jgi:hypothetical protein
MRHLWHEVRGSFDGRLRIADFRCAQCKAYLANAHVDEMETQRLREDCPHRGNPEAVALVSEIMGLGKNRPSHPSEERRQVGDACPDQQELFRDGFAEQAKVFD